MARCAEAAFPLRSLAQDNLAGQRAQLDFARTADPVGPAQLGNGHLDAWLGPARERAFDLAA